MAAPLPAEPLSLAMTIKSIRLRKGLSQSKLAARLGNPRTWASKLETGRTTPTLHSLEKLALALEVSIAELLGGLQAKHTNLVRELVADPFVAQIIPSLPMLSNLQKDGLLVRLHHMTTRQRTA
jgi:transcriptional regulator with XRE-family HTH domain